ncbi:hypothetical protein VN12_09265 [Pirellula sp. SH-Sr6A]|uniref:DUF1592 domain-containing protein n=1 Tax=Pirellula sp. SH-Sr6A TaxID=1632865 RepID=UPI00078BCAD6|nr:DUF1592 domain-containing protein [Pirellula sp. SH-Sr6A]AMV32300.1 hypothetical protein VN12_09265 [Pirellula sp. SH-Sr6A]
MLKFVGFSTIALSVLLFSNAWAPYSLGQSASAFPPEIAPIFQRYCSECHSNETDEGNLSFEAWGDTPEIDREKKLTQILRVLKLEEMPPEGSEKPSAQEMVMIQKWSQSVLDRVAEEKANDPGPIILRRLSNSEYTWTLRDLTGVPTLDPTKEFPVDNVAGEGFTNAGAAMVMSPALFNKYFDAAKSIAQRTVLLPDGIGFSESTSSNDWATERLNWIRQLYARYTDARGAEKVNLQGVQFETNQGGRNPFDRYLELLFQNENALATGSKSLQDVAKIGNGSERYLAVLAKQLGLTMADSRGDLVHRSELGEMALASPLVKGLRSQWALAKGKPSSADVSNWVGQWQQKLWKFSAVGHIGKLNGPKAWQEPVDPLTHRLSIRHKLNAQTDSLVIELHEAGDGRDGDYVQLASPRFIRSGESDLPLVDAIRLASEWKELASTMRGSVEQALAIAEGIDTAVTQEEIRNLAGKASLSESSLALWLELVGLFQSDAGKRDGSDEVLFTKSASNLSGHAFIGGWVGEDALSIVANSSDMEVRIPGVMTPKSIAMHPAPTRSIGAGWTASRSGKAKIDAVIQHAHPECGNGIAWLLEIKRRGARIGLASGNSAGGKPVPIGPFSNVPLLAGDEVRLWISPKDGNHSCDLTRVDFTIEQGEKRWNLSESLHAKLTESNPLADHSDTKWQFFHAPVQKWSSRLVPPGSLLSQWFLSADTSARSQIASKLQQLLKSEAPSEPISPADQQLLKLFSTSVQWGRDSDPETKSSPILLESSAGEMALTREGLSLADETWVKIPIPAFFREEWEFAAEATLDPHRGRDGSVQILVQNRSDASAFDRQRDRSSLIHEPVLVHPEGSKERVFRTAFEDFRNTFPIALCYPQIVPVDEVVTLTLYHREDRFLKELMLTDSEREELERLWTELHFVSQDALRSVDVFEQLWQYATQDADPSAFEPLREPILKRAAQFREELVRAEEKQLNGVLEFAAKAFRRALRAEETERLRGLYRTFREQGLLHDASIRGVVTRILVAPEFLYRLEVPAKSQSEPLRAEELATRLSYFLWSSAPDETLLGLAADGSLLREPILRQQVRRMLEDPRSSRMATSFFGQWLQIANVAELDEKSEKEFPEFLSIRGNLQAEANRLFEHLLMENRPPLELLTADYMFVDRDLAGYYGIPIDLVPASNSETEQKDGGLVRTSSPVTRLGNASQWNRGGLLTLGALLSKLSGASRTSPILRGTWVSEVLLGEPLPKPPKNVPQLPDSVPENLSERQLTELHVSAPGCSNCHRRIDPFGFALESYDAIGRYRTSDKAGHLVDTKTALPDGTVVSGVTELRDYLVRTRNNEFLLQFHRKLLGYALGREVMLSDKLFLESLAQRATTESSYGIGDAVEAIVMSRQFREIRSEEEVKP